MFIVNATFFCLFSFALVCLRISIRKRVSSKAFSFFTSGQGASTRTWTLQCISSLLSSVLSTYLDPSHVKVGVIWSPVTCLHTVYLHHTQLAPSQHRQQDVRGKSSCLASVKPSPSGRRWLWWLRLRLRLRRTCWRYRCSISVKVSAALHGRDLNNAQTQLRNKSDN